MKQGYIIEAVSLHKITTERTILVPLKNSMGQRRTHHLEFNMFQEGAPPMPYVIIFLGLCSPREL